SLVWAVIEAPHRGWTDNLVLAAFAASLALGLLFVRRQLHARDPLLDVGLFKKPTFSLGSLAISSAFFALFGLIFLTTQYLQFVQGRSASAAFGIVRAASTFRPGVPRPRRLDAPLGSAMRPRWRHRGLGWLVSACGSAACRTRC